MNKFKHLNEYLTIHDQLHVLKYWNDLNAQQQDNLYDQLINIDLNQVKSINLNSKQSNDLINQLDFTQQHQLPQSLGKIINTNYEQTGLKVIHDNKLAVITLAGGLSKRLSVSYPKGLYSCDLLSNKSLFQLQAEKLIKIKQLSNLNKTTQSNNNTISWYIMTSDHTHAATIDHFKANNYFGLQSKNVLFFKQKQFPCLNKNNKLILENKFKIRMAPNGSGGLYEALLDDNQILTDMKQKNIQFVHICGIENILTKIADPIFIGYCLETNTQCGIKITEKIRHNEPINNLVFNSHLNKLNLVDFTLINSDLSTQIKFETNNKDSLFNFGDICSYFIEFDLLKKLAIKFKLDYYKLNTRLTCLNLSTDLEEKQKCFYFEKFLTHSFQDFKLFKVDRNNEYAPLEYMHHKNLYHTKYVCKKSLNDLHYDWLIRAGAKFYYTSTKDLIKYNDAQNICEISPLVSYDGENLESLVEGKSFEPPLVLELDSETNEITFNGLSFKEFNSVYPTNLYK